jgi:hypothetical protein
MKKWSPKVLARRCSRDTAMLEVLYRQDRHRCHRCSSAVPALLRTEWWPIISFVVFMSPPEGRTHIFRPGEPMLQILVVPVQADFDLVQMDEEAAEREMRGRRIHASRPTLAAEATWVSDSQAVFDGTYRHLLRAAKARPR